MIIRLILVVVLLACSSCGFTPMRTKYFKHDDGRVEQCSANVWGAAFGPLGAWIAQSNQNKCVVEMEKNGFKEYK